MNEKIDSSEECWNCGGTHFVAGHAGMLICAGCHELQDDEDTYVRDERYDHW